ncbi:MAG: hypothetical protein US74_C0025G0001 [Parcubacteria group bacterium GW2011_GWA2_38_13]|nr:MAG: hypothetical protein US74_C0025G0001 [Parcubacteria group bacterium GW2011_GWA2_38_13]
MENSIERLNSPSPWPSPEYKITVEVNIEQDIWNWWNSGQTKSYGEDWGKRIPEACRDKIVKRTQEQAHEFLLPRLEGWYMSININRKRIEAQSIFDMYSKVIFERMEKVTGRKICRKDFICFLTTFCRGPYVERKGYIWLITRRHENDYIASFLHELLHFQTHTYWEKIIKEKLAEEEFNNLKEALTVILDEEFKDIMECEDGGYKDHKALRERILCQWKEDKNFDRLIEFGIKIYPEYREQLRDE